MPGPDRPEKRGRRPVASMEPPVISRPVPLRKYHGPICQDVKQDGSPCHGGATALSGYTRCPRHDPGLGTADEKALWWTKGGRQATGSIVQPSAMDPELDSPGKITAYLNRLAGQGERGDLGPGQVQALVSVANAALRSFEADVVRRLETLEAVAAKRARGLRVV